MLIDREQLKQVALESARRPRGNVSRDKLKQEVYRDLKGAVGPIAAFFLRWLLLKIAGWAVDMILEGDDGRGD